MARAWVTRPARVYSARRSRSSVTRPGVRRRCAARRREVWCLQTAAQFGDPGGAARLAELTTVVQGPRVTPRPRTRPRCVTATATVCSPPPDATRNSATGSRPATPPPKPPSTYRDQGRRGAAHDRHRVRPAPGRRNRRRHPRAARERCTDPVHPAPARDHHPRRHGWSNRQIAEHLTMSVRTVEGHLLRASQRTGVNSRDELIALLTGT